MKKPKAEDRTVDMFTGKANVDLPVSIDDTPDSVKPAETIEQIAERGREKAFETAEYLSKKWGQAIDGGTYRLTVRGDLMLLEQFRHNGKEPGAYGWTGVMFPSKDHAELAGLMVKSWNERKAK